MPKHDWKLTDKTSPSGKFIFRCDNCDWELSAPTDGVCGTCESCKLPIGCVGHALNCEPKFRIGQPSPEPTA